MPSTAKKTFKKKTGIRTVPGRHSKNDANRMQWVDPYNTKELPGPADYDQAQTTVSRGVGKIVCTKFSQSKREDIDNLPCLGPDPENTQLKSDIELFPGPDHYGEVKPVARRVEGGVFPVGKRRDHIDAALNSSMHVPGPSHYDGGYTPTMPLPTGGKMANVPRVFWLDTVMDRANDTPGPSHGHRVCLNNLSTKTDDRTGVKLAKKVHLHNYQTSLSNAVSYHAETCHPLGPNQCRSDTAFNEQLLTYSRNAPGYSFGSNSCKQKQIQRNREMQGAVRLIPKTKQKEKKGTAESIVVGYIAPRVTKRNDFEKFYGYNPGASATDLKNYFGYDRGLGKTGAKMSASKSLNSLTLSAKKSKKTMKKRAKKVRVGPHIGPVGQPRDIGGRAGHYIKVQPTPGPNYKGCSDFGVMKAGPGTFGTD
jgi:hypothetical protein